MDYAQFVTDNLGRDYPDLLHRVKGEGEFVKSRNGNCWELVGGSLVLTEPRLCVVDREGFSHAFMREEIVQLLAGEHHNDRLRAVVPRAADLITPLTAYGPRVRGQLIDIEAELARDPYSRRALVYVGRAIDLANTLRANATEMPCTATWQFLVRDDRLDMVVTMRSCDVVWGLCYDVPSFVSVQMALARALGVELGRYFHQAGSLHLYERHGDVEARVNVDSALDVDDLLRDLVIETQKHCREVLRAT